MKTKLIFKNKHIEIYFGSWDFVFRYCTYPEKFNDLNDNLIIGLLFFKLYITLPWSHPFSKDNLNGNYCDCKSYGFDFCNSATNKFPVEVFLYKGFKTHIIDLPWALTYYKTTYYDKYGNIFFRYADSNKNIEKIIPNINRITDFTPDTNYTHSYKYVRKNGDIQNTQATYHIEEWEWRRKWLMFTKLFNHKRKEISISFADEIGERVDTWKGGVIGCDYEMKPGETATQTLLRMEKERKFD